MRIDDCFQKKNSIPHFLFDGRDYMGSKRAIENSP